MDSLPDEAAHTPLLRQRWRDALVQAMPEAEWHWQWPADEAVLRRAGRRAANPPSGPLAAAAIPGLGPVGGRASSACWPMTPLPAHVRLAGWWTLVMSLAMGETATWAVLSLHRHFFDLASAAGCRPMASALAIPGQQIRGALGW